MTNELELDPVGRLADEFVARFRRGERPSIQEYVDRYPEHAETIRDTFEALAMMENLAPASDDSFGERAQDAGRVDGGVMLDQLGDYRIIREVGRGGMGIVYEAEQISLGRHVALKVLPADLLASLKHRHRFEREARAAAKLHHTNIVPVFGVGEDSGMGYYVMQFIRGLALDDVLDELKRLHSGRPTPPSTTSSSSEVRLPGRDVSAVDMARSLMTGAFPRPEKDAPSNIDETVDDSRRPSAPAQSCDGSTVTGRLSDTFAVSETSSVLPGSSNESKRPTYWQSVAHIGRQVAEALAYAHAQGVLHRDIKPGNLLVDTCGTVWVTDFGLAKLDDDLNLTHTGDVLGTIRYMAPETFKGKADARSEVYSLGLTLYEMLSLQPAFTGRSRNSLVDQVLNSDVQPLVNRNADIPRDLQIIVHKAIDRDPRHRYQCAQDLADDLQRFVDDEPIHARRVTFVERSGRWCRRNPLLATATCIAVTALVAIAVIATMFAQTNALSAEKLRGKNQDLETAQGKLQETVRLLRQTSYRADMNLACWSYEFGNIGRMVQLLERHRPQPGADDEDLRGFEWRHMSLAGNLHRELIPSPGGPVFHLAVSPDGRMVAANYWDGTCQIYDGATYRVLHSMKAAWTGGAFSGDGKLLATGQSHDRVQLWNTDDWSVVGVLERRRQSPKDKLSDMWSLAFSPTQHLVAWQDMAGQITLWNTDTCELVGTINAKQGRWRTLAFSPDGNTLMAASGDHSVVLIDVADRRIKRESDRHVKKVTCVAFSPNGELLATASLDGTVRLWDENLDPLALLEASAPLTSVAFSPNGKLLVAGTEETNRALVWDMASPGRNRLIRTIAGHSRPIHGVAFVGDDQTVWTAGDDAAIKVWDLSRCEPYDRVTHVTGSVAGEVPTWKMETRFMAYAADGRTLLFSDDRGVIRRWDTIVGEHLEPLDGGASYAQAAISDNGAILAGVMPDGELRVWDLAKRQLVGTHRITDERYFHLAATRDGRVAWNRFRDGKHETVIWSVSDGAQHVPEIHGGNPWRPLIFSPDGRRMVYQEFHHTYVWDFTAAPYTRLQLNDDTWAKMAAAFSPDGATVAIVKNGLDYEIKLHDVETGKQILTMKGQDEPIDCLAFAADGKTLVSGGRGGSVAIWDVDGGQLRAKFKHHIPTGEYLGGVTSVAFSSSGETIATCGADGTIRVWKTGDL